jgi:hypothetical protein
MERTGVNMNGKEKAIVLASLAFVVLFLTYPIWRMLLTSVSGRPA